MSDLVGCTIVSKNYLPFARVLARSFRRHHPGGRFYTLLVDRVDGYFDPADEPFDLVCVEDLDNIPDLRAFLFKYTILEVNTAVKPFFLEHLLAEHGARRLLYFDPDILILRRLEIIEEVLESSAVVLTPHLTAPIDDDLFPDELAILRAGAYNLGFLGLADGPTARRFLGWWQDRVHDRCVVRVEEGLFVDQKWVDLVPGMFEGVRIVRHPGLNVAYWNLHSREVTLGDPPRVNGEPLYFFHFSGIRSDDLESVSAHQNRFTLEDLGELRALFVRYRELLVEAGIEEARSWPFAFGALEDGTPIPDVARSLYLSLGDARERFGNPFSTGGDRSLVGWMNAPVRGRGKGGLTRLLYHLHETRLDLQAAFPDPCGADLVPFVEWLDLHGRQQYRLDGVFWAPVAPTLGGPSASQGLFRRLKRGLKRLYESQPARHVKDGIKAAVGERRVEGLKRVKRRILGPGPDAGAPTPTPPASDLHLDRVGVNLTGYLRTESGMGESARSLARALEQVGVPHDLCDLRLGVRSRMEDPSFEAFTDAPEYGVNLFVVNADQVGEVTRHVGATRFEGRYNVGCWSWEQESFPRGWLGAFDRFDEIWTPSRFAVEALSSVSPIPVRRVPHTVEIAADPEANRARFGLPEDRHVFLFIFDFLSYVGRKNPLGLVRAFRRAFGGDDRAHLVLKTINSERNPEALAELEQEATGASVQLMDRYLERQEVYDLMAVCDCYVSLHRSEGFGLTMAEAMCLGKPVIATAYSGNTDFMTVANSLPVGYRLVSLEEDEGPYAAGTRWAEPDEEHAAELMRSVLEHPEDGLSLGERARADIAASLSREAVGGLVRERILDILRRHPPAGMPSPHPPAPLVR